MDYKKQHKVTMIRRSCITGKVIWIYRGKSRNAGYQAYHKAVYDEYIARRNCLVEGLNKIPGVYSPMPMGAFYTVAKLPVKDIDDFCRWCLEEFNYEGETVMMAPASGFYATPCLGKDEVRMAYVLKIDDLKRALVVLEKALEAYNAR
jgi:aspartate aminotransferase